VAIRVETLCLPAPRTTKCIVCLGEKAARRKRLVYPVFSVKIIFGLDPMASDDEALEDTLQSLGLSRFVAPAPKPGGLVHVFQILEERSCARLAGLSDDYAAPGGMAFGFAEHRDLDAIAERSSKDVICIHSALIRTIWSLANAMMTIREMFPWVDDIDRLGEPPPPPKGELFYVQQATFDTEPIRRKLGAALFDAPMDFVLMHEVGHLWNGHVDFLHQKHRPMPYREMRLAETSGLDLAEVQALEFDADSFAVQKLFARTYRENPFAEFSAGLLKDHRVPQDGALTASWYFTWFSLYMLFRAFDESCAVSGIEIRPQPPAALRLACLLPTVAGACARQGWSKLDIGQWEVLASDAALEAEAAFCRLRHTGVDSAAFRSAWDGRAFDLIDIHLRTWDRIGPILAPLRRGAMPAKAAVDSAKIA
jgi:hypothetical protein